MKCPALVHAVLFALLTLSAACGKPPTAVPNDFLRTESTGWKKILATEITVHFRKTSLRDAIHFIARQAQANMTLALEAPSGSPIPGVVVPDAPGHPAATELRITEHFEHTPLRVVLFRLSQDTHLVVDWLYLPESPRVQQAIRIHSK